MHLHASPRTIIPPMNAIETRQLTKRYGRLTALDRLTLNVPAGAIFGFLGPNGAGKTTTLRLLVGLIRADGGSATLFGMDAWRDTVAIRRRVGYLPGDLRLYNHLTGRQTLDLCGGARGVRADDEIARLCKRFEFNPDRRVREYSRGNKQKLGLIQALMHRPELLILDEPTTSLDPLVQQTLYDELRGAAGRGATVLFSSHTLSEVEALCEQIAIVRGGVLVEAERIDVLRARAIRRVEFTWNNGAAATPPEGLMVRERAAERCRGAWRGPVQPLLRWLADAPIRDVIIQPPDLEELFLSYYGADGAATTPAPDRPMPEAAS